MGQLFNFEKIVNFRSFTGLKTAENATIKDGRIYRSALLDFATPNDMDLLQSLAPDVVVDFRLEGEKQGEGIKLILDSIDYQAKPIDVGNFFSPDQISALSELKSEDIGRLFEKMYKEFPTCGAVQFKTVFDAILANERVVYHCSAGKDRTGVMSYLILSVLGVPYDDIMENYLESNRYAEALHQLFRENRRKAGHHLTISEELEALFKKIRYVAPEYLDVLDKTLVENYGGAVPYVEKVLKVDTDALKKVLLK